MSRSSLDRLEKILREEKEIKQREKYWEKIFSESSKKVGKLG